MTINEHNMGVSANTQPKQEFYYQVAKAQLLYNQKFCTNNDNDYSTWQHVIDGYSGSGVFYDDDNVLREGSPAIVSRLSKELGLKPCVQLYDIFQDNALLAQNFCLKQILTTAEVCGIANNWSDGMQNWLPYDRDIHDWKPYGYIYLDPNKPKEIEPYWNSLFQMINRPQYENMNLVLNLPCTIFKRIEHLHSYMSIDNILKRLMMNKSSWWIKEPTVRDQWTMIIGCNSEECVPHNLFVNIESEKGQEYYRVVTTTRNEQQPVANIIRGYEDKPEKVTSIEATKRRHRTQKEITDLLRKNKEKIIKMHKEGYRPSGIGKSVIGYESEIIRRTVEAVIEQCA